ncbi:cupin domain-containing protein [Azospirillum sp.]|uniref:cupin domain-containing protein n=1 Tax=Azospirillum sp. TaxID=34012 RepID=UPI002D327FF9|nr:cupin domain-containing protein [Azospirillum sp.]HYD69223.1 cupin domain-containing protein [Azospirillum sp.]
MPPHTDETAKPVVVDAPAQEGPRGLTGYPEPFRACVAGRSKVKLGDQFGLTNFGVNITRLEPGASSALRHWHTRQDEFVYMLEGELVLITDAGEHVLKPGMCAGFPAGVANGHHLVNRTDRTAVYLEVGDRTKGDDAFYSDEDMQFRDGKFLHRDGTPW